MRNNRLILFLLTALPLAGLAAYGALGSLTRLIADDFCLFYFADRLELFRSIWYWYLNWGGRYTAFAIDWLVLKTILGPYRLEYSVPATLLLWMIGTAGTLYLYFYKKNRSALLHALALAGISIFVVLLLTPDITQSLFWWSGMRTYTLPLVVLTFYLLLFLLVRENGIRVHPAVGGALGFLLFFLSGGLNEVMAVAQTAFLGILLALHFLKYWQPSERMRTVLFASLAGSLASLVVVILSPGNAIRQSLLPPPPDFATLASISVMSFGSFIADFFTDPARIAGLAGAMLASLWIGSQYRDQIPDRQQLITACLSGGLLIAFVCFPPGVYGFSEPPPPRTLIIPVYFLMAGILCAGFLAGGWLAESPAFARLSSAVLPLVILVLVGFSVLTSVGRLYAERQTYIDFAEKWDQVDAYILQARAEGQESVTIPALNVWTGGGGDPTANPRYWVNQCYSLYYGLTVLGP